MIKEHITLSEAVLIMTETNLRQRSFADLSESERAICLKQHYEAMKGQGRRTDLLKEIEAMLHRDSEAESLTSSETVTKLRSDEKLGAEYQLNRDKVAKYVRIAGLIPPLLERLDQGEITFLAAYDLSFMEDTVSQEILEEYLQGGYRLDKKKAELIHVYAKEKRLTEAMLEEILSGNYMQKQEVMKVKPIRVNPGVISRFFTPVQSRKEIEETIEKALELYFSGREMKEQAVV